MPGDRLLGAVELAHGDHRPREREAHAVDRRAGELLQADHDLVALLGELERPHRDRRLAAVPAREAQQRERPAERARVRRRLPGEQRLVEAVAGPDDPPGAPVAGVPGERDEDAVVAEVVGALLERPARAGRDARRVDEREAEGVAVRLVPAVAAVVEHGGAERAGGVGDVGPLLRRHLVAVGPVGGPLHDAEAEVVGRHLVRRGERERRLEQRLLGAPVDVVADLEAVAGAAGGEADALGERGAGRLAHDLERDARRAVLDDPHRRRGRRPPRAAAAAIASYSISHAGQRSGRSSMSWSASGAASSSRPSRLSNTEATSPAASRRTR